jgi:hypothetical protein
MRDALRAADADTVAVLESCIEHRPENPNTVKAMATPVRVHVHCRRKRLLDYDNVHYKPVIDGIRASGLLPDDRPEYFVGAYVTQEQGEPEETIVTLEAVDAQATS